MGNKVTGQVLGGQPQTFDGVSSVADLQQKLGLEGNYSATVNGEPAESSDSLSDFSFVSFTKSVKGGNA